MNCSDKSYLFFAIVFTIIFYGAIVPTFFVNPAYSAAMGVSWFIY